MLLLPPWALVADALQILDSGQSQESPDSFFQDGVSGWQARLVQKQQNINTELGASATLLPALRSRVIKVLQLPHSAESHQAADKLLEQCLELDLQQAAWPSTLPQDWQYITVAKALEPRNTDYANVELYPGSVDVYYDGWISHMWNSHRCMRLFLNAIITRCVSYLTPAHGDLKTHSTYVDAVHNIQDLVDDICSSTPFHIGYYPSTAEMACQYANVPAMRPVEPIAIGAYFFLWPLFVSWSAITIPQKQQDWIRGTMLKISERFGSTKALELMKIHQQDPKRPLYAENWDSSFFENLFEAASLYACGGL